MPFAVELKCEVCNKTYDLQNWLEDTCGFRLRVVYDKEARVNAVSKIKYQNNLAISHWRYSPFFPVNDPNYRLTIGEGGTKLVQSTRLAPELGLHSLYFKLESGNPSGSFKDRPISVGASVAYENNAEIISAASSGNAAAALSSYAAKAGMKAVVFVPERASQSKVSQLVTLGATVVRVQAGEYSEGDPSVQLFRAAVKEWGWTPCPSFGPFNPFQFEGTKSLGYEIIEQLNWEVPDWILCNTGSGGLLSGTAEGFFDWEELGWIDALPKFVVVQPNACDPIVQSFNQKLKPFEFRDKEGFPDTVAGGLADPHPWDGDSALDVLYRTNGAGVSVSDAEIMEGQTRLASREGIFGSPTGVAAIAALIKMVNDGQIDSSDTIVIPVTDHGLKDPNVLESRYKEAILCSTNILELQDKLPK
ncbi:MAG: threonine synthase [Candidatus Kariarchaeaceae archaeon]